MISSEIREEVFFFGTGLVGERTNRFKRAAMDWAGAVFTDSIEMFSRSISFVPVESVLGVLLVILPHDAVTMNFGEDAGRGDYGAFGIALDDGDQGYGLAWNGGGTIPVDEGDLWQRFQAGYDPGHGGHGGVKDIEAIDGFVVQFGDGK